ncbi:hypothetical protein [Streptomyces sp. MN13]
MATTDPTGAHERADGAGETPRITHLAPLAAALESGDRAETFVALAGEALALYDRAPESLREFWLDLAETFARKGQAVEEQVR